MFYYLKGTIAAMEANLAVVDCGGVGFACHTTTYTQGQLKLGQVSTLYTHCNIREDAFDIYGFATKKELSAYQMLIGVNGVGPKAALAILSSCTPESFSLAILTGDEKALTAAPGVGKKLAQRIILELKDKLSSQTTELDFSDSGLSAAASPAAQGIAAEVSAALQALGYSSADVAAALRGADLSSMSVQDGIRLGLRNMMK